MKMNFLRHAVIFALAGLIASSAFAQSETGAIFGRVVDVSKAALPGVTVEARSPQLQGVRSEVTDAGGTFRLNLLPPGVYTVTATLAGFNTVTQPNTRVGLNRNVTLEITMSPQVSEQITVRGAAPVVDVTSASSGANVTSETMQALPLPRSYVGAAALAPGTNSDATGVTVYGSSGAENVYIIDGINTTGVRSGTSNKDVNMDFIQEVHVMTGGEPPEYGRLTGGVINAITKSGGNTFTGGISAFDRPQGLRAKNKSFTQRSVLESSVTEQNKNLYDYGANLGGYILKDRIWFFGAFDRQDGRDVNTRIQTPLTLPNFSLPVGATLNTSRKQNLYSGKLTFNVTESQNLAASLIGDPTTISGPLFAIAGPPSTFMGDLKTGANDYKVTYNGIFGQNFVAEVTGGRHNEKREFAGPGTQIPLLLDQTVSPNIRTGGFGFFANEKYSRDQIDAKLSYFLGNHDIGFGAEHYNVTGDLQNYQGGAGQLIYKFMDAASGRVYYRHRFYIDDLAPGFVRSDPTTWKLAVPQVTSPQSLSNAAYLQDSWKAMPNLTLNFGVRWESQEVRGRTGTAFKLSNNWAPRLGVIWDVLNNGRSKAYANFGRYFEDIPMDINIRAFGGELVCFCYNFSPDPANWQPDPAAPKRSAALGGGKEPVDPNLKAQHIDEYLFGYDQEVAPNLSVGIKATYRNLANVIEDMLIGTTGDYLIANPGTGIGREAGFYEGGSVVTPRPKRSYKGFELHAEKRFSNNTQFFASYLWSRLEGNYDGTFQASTGQLDPNINSAFDYADFIVNNHGLLSNDRTHQLKFYGSYTFSNGMMKGLDLGLATHYASGTPLSANGYSFAYGNWEYYLTTRGALGRGPADYEADIHVGYPITMGTARVSLIADVFNVLNLQRKTLLDTRYNRPQDNPCAGFVVPSGAAVEDVCTGDNGLRTIPGTVNPVGKVDPNAAPNPSFLKAGRLFTDPRTIRFGVRVAF